MHLLSCALRMMGQALEEGPNLKFKDFEGRRQKNCRRTVSESTRDMELQNAARS